MILEWQDGANNHRHYTFQKSSIGKNFYNLTYTDYDIDPNLSLIESWAQSLENRNTKFVEVLYSGGIDSEAILKACMLQKIPVKAVTAKLMNFGYPINIVDLYYSQKFCRENNIDHTVIEIDIDKFFSQQYIQYLKPLYITAPHVAVNLWLAEQCTGFPVIGGEYCWPKTNLNKVSFSPHRLSYSVYDRAMSLLGIHGMGNIFTHSLESNVQLIKSHITSIEKLTKFDERKLPLLKAKIFENVGLGQFELRTKSWGWEQISSTFLDQKSLELVNKFNLTRHTITWQSVLGASIGIGGGTSDSFY